MHNEVNDFFQPEPLYCVNRGNFTYQIDNGKMKPRKTHFDKKIVKQKCLPFEQSFSDYYQETSQYDKNENETILGYGNYYIHDAVF